MADRSALTLQDVREVLRSCTALGLSAEFDDDTPLVIDSFAAVWVQHVFLERHGVEVEVGDLQGAGVTVAALHARVSGTLDA